MPKPNQQIEILLRYVGPEVEDGSMSLDDLVPVLQGFASAYGKVAGRRGIAGQHKLRLVAIRPGCADLILDVWGMIGKNTSNLQAVAALVISAMAIVSVIIQVITLKKHTKKQPYQTRADGQSGLIVVVNSENVSISASPEVFNMFREGELDGDLSKITRPLESGRVDSSTIIVRDGQDEIQETINASERQFFEVAEESVTSTRETTLTGQINTMTKSTNSGYVYLTDGTRVFFRLVAEHPENYYNLFSHSGLVRMCCIAHLDENLKVTQLDVSEITPLQPNLPFEGSESNSDNSQT